MSLTVDSAPFIKTIKDTLHSKGWSQAQLSDKSGLSRSQISRLLAGKNKRVHQSTVSKLLNALNIDQDDFLATSDSEKLTQPTTTQFPMIYSDRLPTVTGQCIGRQSELEVIEQALHAPDTHILQIIAPGGTGKTKLLRQWLNNDRDSEQSVIAWSFYSQGASPDKQASANPFFQHALSLFDAASTTFATEEDKGDYLANVLRKHNCLLILDGVEPLQYADAANRGEIKDRALSRLLRNMAGQAGTFCIVTSRIAVYELSDRTSVKTHQLQNLDVNDGVALLQSLGVHGSDKAIQQAVTHYDGHALSLHLLGNLLRLRYQGDINQRDKLPTLMRNGKDKTSRHAFAVMQAYEEWLSGTTELQVLYLLGLFDCPVGIEVLETLWHENIPHLTAGFEEIEWYQAIESIRHDHHLLNDEIDSESPYSSPQTLDCHPLIREYFGIQFKETQPEAWYAAHRCLFEYYKALPEKELPDTLEEMRPLFEAVKHGCSAELYEEAFEIYWQRVSRKTERFLSSKLGAYSDDLATISHFFSEPWSLVKGEQDESTTIFLMLTASQDLTALGRIRETYTPSTKVMTYLVSHEQWQQAALFAELICQQQLTLGSLQDAINIANQGIQYTQHSDTTSESTRLLVLLARSKHQAGDYQESERLIIEAKEHHQQENQNLPLPLLIPEYIDLLIEQEKTDKLIEQSTLIQGWSNRTTVNATEALQVSLALASFAKAFVLLQNLEQAIQCSEASVTFLRQSGRKDLLPLALLARACVYRETSNFSNAYQDLQEVYDIAHPSGMRLYLTDYHLEMARVLLKQWQQHLIDDSVQVKMQEHIDAAVKLINETGYHRRDKEVTALVGPVQSASQQPKKWSEEW